ncbi:granulin 1 [Megalops cyprinoides]|uniref:granulin 1 n=1 Tax=Megalops cyprinoides TaxID=118141 RepID=UPI0018640434|nr:granulin 1 [Megalops cyprinoides]
MPCAVMLVLLMAGFASSSQICPDGKVCPHLSTCCEGETGYQCCPVPNAVCCPDKSHCCPQGFQCNMQTNMCERSGGRGGVPMLRKTAAEEPSTDLSGSVEAEGVPALPNVVSQSSAVHCDDFHTCPEGTTCCRHPAGVWFCCAYSHGYCCLDGYHCCPFGYHCDLTYTRCLVNGLSFPFAAKPAAMKIRATEVSQNEPELIEQDECCGSRSGCCPEGFRCGADKTCVSDSSQHPLAELHQALSVGSQDAVIICDQDFYCPAGKSCCRSPTGGWGCCPYPLGQCCLDGVHCCEYGYKCDATSKKCTKGYAYIPSGLKETAHRN